MPIPSPKEKDLDLVILGISWLVSQAILIYPKKLELVCKVEKSVKYRTLRNSNDEVGDSGGLYTVIHRNDLKKDEIRSLKFSLSNQKII